MTRDRIDAVFGALADATRREVLRRLSEGGPVSATELSRGLPVTRQAVVKHLCALEGAGLVRGERRGRERLYRLTLGPLTEAVSWMADVGAEWDERLDALRRHISGRRR